MQVLTPVRTLPLPTPEWTRLLTLLSTQVSTTLLDAPDASTGPTVVDISDPTMEPRQSFAARTVGDGRVIFAGGFGGRDTPIETWAFDPATTTWAQLENLPAPHIGASSIVLPDGRMLIAGGVPEQFARMTNDALFVFDPATNMWSAAGTMTEARGGHAMYMLERGPDTGKIVIIGGSRRTMSGSDFLDTFELYDPATMTSTALPGTTLPSTRASYMHFAMSDGRIAILGGYETPGDPDGSAIDQIVVYDPMDHSVAVQSETLPESELLGLLGTLPDGRHLVFPGRYSTNTIRLLDPDTFTFTDTGAVPENLASYGGALTLGRVYLFGGRDDDALHANINQYDPTTDTWTELTDILPMALAGIRATVIADGRVILMGGQTDLGFIVGDTNLFTP